LIYILDFKDHKTHRVTAEKLSELHGEYSKIGKFPVPLHPKNLAQLIHPFYGYLANMQGLTVSFDELH
jgi:hypothetical protein